MNKSLTLKDLKDFAKENGLSEDTKLHVFGRSRILPVISVSTESPSEDALYADVYLEIEKEEGLAEKVHRTSREIAEIVSLCVACDKCAIREKCDTVYGESKTETMCIEMWQRWLQGHPGINYNIGK